MKDTIVSQCLDILKRDDIKHEFRKILSPFINLILNEVNPYIYITIGLVFSIFIINLANLIILLLFLRNKKTFSQFNI
jgi:hypothetical protein